MKYRADIDGLRTLAILPVLLFHAFPKLLPGGFIGVDIFFVISGFLISNIILGELKLGSFSILNFYAKRFRRILPALLTMMIVVFAAGYFTFFPTEFHSLGKELIAGSLFSSNILFWMQAGYFDTSSDLKPLLHLWSLGIEEQFYLIWPYFLILAHRFPRFRALILGFITLVSFGACLFMTHRSSSSAFYLLPFRLWELSSGGLLALAVHNRETLRLLGSKVSSTLASLAIFACLGGFFWIGAEAFPGYWALVPVLSTVVLIATGPHTPVARRVLSSRPFVTIGKLSYPLYLWHWPVLVFLRIYYQGHPPVQIVLLGLFLTFVLAWLTYEGIEKKVSRTFFVRSQSRILVSSIIFLLAFTALGQLSRIGFFEPTRRHFVKSELNLYDESDKPIAEMFKTLTSACNETMDKEIHCRQEEEGLANIALLGDSHARALLPGLLKVNDGLNWLVVSRGETPPLGGETEKSLRGKDFSSIVNSMLSRIADDDNVEKVVIATRYTPYFKKGEDGSTPLSFSGSSSDETEDRFFESLEKTITLFQGQGKKVYLVQELPEFPKNPIDCLLQRPINLGQKSNPKDCEASFRDYQLRDSRANDQLLKLSLQHKVPLIDLSTALCDAQRCSPYRERKPLFSDTHHLNLRGSKEIGRRVLETLAADRIQEL